MRVVIDAIPVRFGGFAVALESTLAGWESLGYDDDVHVVVADDAELAVPGFASVQQVRVSGPSTFGQALAQSRVLPRVCRQREADVMLGILPTTAITPVGCPKVITVYDLRHELLPEQFSAGRRALRKLSYDLGYRQSTGIICISERTRGDLLRSRPGLEPKVTTVPWAADHVDTWPRRPPEAGSEPYALAFGHFVNKAVDRVIAAWELLAARGDARPLVFVGLPSSEREGVRERIRMAGLEGVITPLPWLDTSEYQAQFASAGLIVFPSDFEGFGLPAVEAMRLGIPLVISPDPALLEVTGGHAEVMEGWDVEALAAAVSRAWARSDEELTDARSHVGRTWADVARETRDALLRFSAPGDDEIVGREVADPATLD